MNQTRSLIKSVTLAVMVGAGLAATVPGLGLGMASAQDRAKNHEREKSSTTEFFRVEWSAKPDGRAGERITGYIHNNNGQAADQVVLRIVALDASSRQIGSFAEPVAGTVPAGDRLYFDLKVPGHASSYRVAVSGFNFVDTAKSTS